MRLHPAISVLVMFGLLLQAAAAPAASPNPLEKIRNIVVIYLENHSFDNLYGLFPGAEGLADAPATARLQTDGDGRPFPRLPPVIDTREKPHRPDPRFPPDLPNQPFDLGRYVPPGERIGDLVHRFYQHQAQIHAGRNDRFAAESDAGGLAMGYYDGSQLPLWHYARRYTLADHFFQAAYGGSFLNHLWLVCACTPRYPHPPQRLVAELDPRGRPLHDGPVTPDGYAINTLFPFSGPHSPNVKDPAMILPALDEPTIGDRLSLRDISWAWYAGGWDDAVAGRADPSFQFHHQPFAYFRRFAEGQPDRALHLKDEAEFVAAIDQGRLPQVAFFKPLGQQNEHPGYTDILSGERRIAELLAKIERSPQWPGILVIVTYDEYGGFWDHVPPPRGDRWGPGSRVPALVVSPFARQGYVDHTVYDTTSILKLIERRFDLKPLGSRDARANDLSAALAP